MNRDRAKMHFCRWIATTILVTVISGCGGGGGGGSSSSGNSLKINVTQNPVTASVAQIDLPAGVTVTATVSGSTSASTLYVLIVDADGTFTGTSGVTQTGNRQYSAELLLAQNLPVGTRAGTLRISICSDANCSNVLGRTTAQYSVNVTESPVVTGEWARSPVVLSAIVGDQPVAWPLRLTTPQLKYIPYARFTDPNGIVRVAGGSQAILAPWGPTNVDLEISPTAAPGMYTGNLEMTYCRDPECTRAWRGVTQLPYTAFVYSPSNTRIPTSLPGAAEWTVYQGNVGRTGRIDGLLNPASFSPRWHWVSPNPIVLPEIFDPVSAAGTVLTIAAPPQTAHITPVLLAIDEGTGLVEWQQPLPDTSEGPTSFGRGVLSPPAIAGSNVYVVRTTNIMPPQASRLFAFQVADGASVFPPVDYSGTPSEFFDYSRVNNINFGMARSTYLTPVGGKMLAARDDLGFRSQASIGQAEGAYTTAWAACPAAQSMIGSAGAIAVDSAGRSYVVTGDTLLMPDSCESIASGLPLANGAGPVAIPGTSSVLVVGDGNLVMFDSSTRTVRWAVPQSGVDAFYGSPAVVGTTVLVNNNGASRLEARRESDGAVLWTWQPPWSDDLTTVGNVVASNNLVFVSTSRRVYAVDLNTHEAVWVYPYPGRLSLSANGTLFVLRSSSGMSLDAVNLQ